MAIFDKLACISYYLYIAVYNTRTRSRIALVVGSMIGRTMYGYHDSDIDSK